MLAKQIGENIKAARKARKLSLQKLAAKIRPATSYQHLSRLEQGSDALNFDWVERIATALNLDPLDLIAPDRAQEVVGFSLGEQVATEVAHTLAAVALQGVEPEPGTVQAVALILQELTATFAKYPEAASDVQVARPAVDQAARRYAPAAN
jgi:transcriptional regulator with XRE-family HTH domain